MATVSLERLTKTFDGGSVAVDDVSLEVADGEFLVLVGPSGCGKTTALRMIAGLEEPTSGRVRIGGRDVTDLAPGARDVAMVFQNYALYPHLTVRENIGFGLRVRRTPRAEMEQKVRAAAELLSIGELLGRRPAQLSGGQRQRVALARAIVREPQVFLFDEPLSNLDAQVRAHTRAELVRLHRELGVTMIYVTHDQVEAMTMAERVAVMHRGRVEQLAPPLALYRRPTSLFVASFIGSPSINRFEGRVEGERFIGAVAATVHAPSIARATLAVRPEHLRLDTLGDGMATVTLVEPLGPETLVRVALDAGPEAIARLDGGCTLAIGARVGVRIAPDAGLVFDERGVLVSTPP